MKFINDSTLNYLVQKFNSFFKKNANNTVNHGKFVVDNIYSDKIDLKDSNGNRIIEVSNKHLNNGSTVHTKDDWTLKIGQITRDNNDIIAPLRIYKNGNIQYKNTTHRMESMYLENNTLKFNYFDVKLDALSTLYLRNQQLTNSPSYINYDTVAVRDAKHRYIYGSTTESSNENKLTIENHNNGYGYSTINMYHNTSKFNSAASYNTIEFQADDYAFYGSYCPNMKLYKHSTIPNNSNKVGNKVFYIDNVDKVTFNGDNSYNTINENDFAICNFHEISTEGNEITLKADNYIMLDTSSYDITIKSGRDIYMYADRDVHIESGPGSFNIVCGDDLNICADYKISNHLYVKSTNQSMKYSIIVNETAKLFNIEANGNGTIKHSKYSMDIPIINSTGTDISSTHRFLWYSYGNSTIDNFKGLKIGYDLWSDEPEIYLTDDHCLIELNTNYQDVYMKLYGDNDDGEIYINCNNQQIFMTEYQEGTYLGGIFLQCSNNRKAYYTKTNAAATANDEIATVGNISSSLSGYIPNAGNTTTGNLTLSRSGDIGITSTGGDITIQVTGTGKKAYYGTVTADNEIATVGATQSSKTIEGNFIHIEDAAALPAEECITTLEPVQEGSGDPSPENVRPITGHTGVELTQTGKNLLDVAHPSVEGYAFSIAGYTQNNGYAISNYIPIIRGESYTYKGISAPYNTNRTTVEWSDNNYEFISYSQPVNAEWQDKGFTVTAPSNAKYLRVTYKKTDVTSGLPLQVECGTTATSYEPYTLPETYSVTFPQAQSPVYGCEVDWTNSVLRVTDVEKILNGNENESWIKSTNANIKAGRAGYYTRGVFTDCKYSGDDYNTNNVVIKFNCFEGEGQSAISATTKESFFIGVGVSGNPNFTTNIWVNTDSETNPDITSWKVWLSQNPIQCIYPLATPIEIPLTPEVITLLQGVNNIYTDSGITKLTYQPNNVIGELKGEIQLLQSQINTLINQLNNLSN